MNDWDNFVLPFLPENYKELIINNVDSSYREDIPMIDYTVIFDCFDTFMVDGWLDYLDKLQYKTGYCIVVTKEERRVQRCLVLEGLGDIRRYFGDWTEIGVLDDLTRGKFKSVCFKSRFIEKVPMGSLDCGNHVQDGFYGDLDNGVDYHKTRYYRILRNYRKEWSREELDGWIEKKIILYDNIKRNGLLKPLIVGDKERILDGNHRYEMMRTLGYKSVFIRRT